MDRHERDALFRRLYQAYQKRVEAVVWHSGVPSRDREDAEQVAWLTVVNGFDDFDPAKGSWVTRISGAARRTARRFVRDGARRAEDLTDETPLTGHDLGPEAVAERERRLAALWAFIHDTLDGPQRDAWLLHHVEELTVPQVAEVLGIERERAKQHIRAAQGRLTRAIARMSEEQRNKLRAVALPLALPALVEAFRDAKRTRGLWAALVAGRPGAFVAGAVAGAAAVWPLAMPSVPVKAPAVVAVHEPEPAPAPASVPATGVEASSPPGLAAPSPSADGAATQPPEPAATPMSSPGPVPRTASPSPNRYASDVLLGRIQLALPHSPELALRLLHDHEAKFGALDAGVRQRLQKKALAQVRSAQGPTAPEK